MELERVEEIMLSPFQKAGIKSLFRKCFEVYPRERIYFNQVPHFRFLVWEKPKLVGHMAISYRTISCDHKRYRVFGVVDLCVDEQYWSRQIASTLIHEAEKFGRENEIEFLVLTTSNDNIYTRNGFTHVDNPCRWVLINNHSTYGVVQRLIGDGFMIKQIGDTNWPDGMIDLMGHMF